METVDVDTVEPTGLDSGQLERRPLSDLLGTDDLAINHYTLAPGEAFSGGIHTHLDQEELFYVLSGTATFETKGAVDDELETVEVGSGQAVRFAPGEYQHGYNDGDESVTALALGAPRPSTKIRVPQPCPFCSESDTLKVYVETDGMTLECPDCGEQMDAGI
jgi:uncharacterized cupin superfamily protein